MHKVSKNAFSELYLKLPSISLWFKNICIVGKLWKNDHVMSSVGIVYNISDDDNDLSIRMFLAVIPHIPVTFCFTGISAPAMNLHERAGETNCLPKWKALTSDFWK